MLQSPAAASPADVSGSSTSPVMPMSASLVILTRPPLMATSRLGSSASSGSSTFGLSYLRLIARPPPRAAPRSGRPPWSIRTVCRRSASAQAHLGALGQRLLDDDQFVGEIVGGGQDGDLAGRAARRGDAAGRPRGDRAAGALEVEIGIGGQQQRHLDGASDQARDRPTSFSRRISAAPVLSRRVSVRSAPRLSMPGMAALRASRVIGK